MNESTEEPQPPAGDAWQPVRELSKSQRRVLGVLIEKGLTTPEYYPLTLKAATAGCNQKSNRSPVTSYSEDAVEGTFDELRQLGLVAVVHTETGRTERFRHYMRRRYPFTESQMAILGELLLRGQQTLGELRGRASRMVAIDSLDALRDELAGLVEEGYVTATGDLTRRGVEVNHGFFTEAEQARGEATIAEPAANESPPTSPPQTASPAPSAPAAASATPPPRDDNVNQRLATLETTHQNVLMQNQELREEVETLREELSDVRESVERLQRELGV